MKNENILECKNISKHFGGVKALSNVDFEIRKGEILALCGENGAGKSTLIKIISGVHKLDHGKIEYQGKVFFPFNPQHAINEGIITIHQELSVVPNLDVVNNIFLNMEYHKYGIFDSLDKKRMASEAKNILKQLGIDIPLKTLLKDLPIASQQMVEIGRAINRKTKILFMDEPTSSLSQSGVEQLFTIVRKLRDKGVSIVFVSHRLEEVLEITDRIVVLRDGHRVGELVTKDTNEDKICQMMVGRDFDRFPKEKSMIGNVILDVKKISGSGFVKNISFQLKKGEILGLAGLVGAGRTELARMLFGADKVESGEIYIDNKLVRIKNPGDAIKFGISYIPENRKTQGLLMNMDVKDNATIATLKKLTEILDKLNRKKQLEITKEYIKSLSIVTSSPFLNINNLSGGNQQKVVISKWLMTEPKILIMDEPTRGIDVGAKSEVHKLISRLAQQGMAILLISSELPEILGMSDRVLVMCQGRITGNCEHDELTEENIMNCATRFRSLELAES